VIHRHCRRGLSLLELMFNSAIASVLLVGLASAVLVANKALNLDQGTSAAQGRNARAVDRLLRDVRHARTFSERTATALTFTVPDRNGDGNPETIRYAWSGTAGDPLTSSYNQGAATAVVDGVRKVNFDYLTRTILAPKIDVVVAPPVTFESFTEVKVVNSSASVSLAVPSGTATGDLLIAAFAIDGGPEPSAGSGWNVLAINNNSSRAQLAVWWKIASASEPSSYTFSFSFADQMYGWMMRFTGNDSTNPINAFATLGAGTTASTAPISPEVTTSVDKCMVLRLGAFDDDDITSNDAGIANHTTITMDSNTTGTNGVSSGGAAYSYQSTAGATGTANFTITDNEEYATVTIAIAPQQ
jgi:hypothetical protein